MAGKKPANVPKRRSESYLDDTDSRSRLSELINRIGEAVRESETLYEFIKKVFHIMFYTKLIMFLTLCSLVFHVSITFQGIYWKKIVLRKSNDS